MATEIPLNKLLLMAFKGENPSLVFFQSLIRIKNAPSSDIYIFLESMAMASIYLEDKEIDLYLQATIDFRYSQEVDTDLEVFKNFELMHLATIAAGARQNDSLIRIYKRLKDKIFIDIDFSKELEILKRISHCIKEKCRESRNIISALKEKDNLTVLEEYLVEISED